MIPQEELMEYRAEYARKKRKAEAMRLWRNDPTHPERAAKHRQHSAAWAGENAKRIYARRNRAMVEDPARLQRRLWGMAKRRAARRGLEFTIKPSDIRVPVKCPVLGFELATTRVPASEQFRSPSVDRIDSSLGYTPDNVIVVSYRANVLKNNATTDELTALAKFYGRIDKERRGQRT